MAEPVALRRTLTLPLLTFYGLGTILGAGIYVLVGEVAGIAGMHAPLAFAVAAAVAAFTAFSYAELAARHPASAAEAVYVQEAFGRTWLSMLVGTLVLFAVINGALVLLIRAARVLHGMSVRGWLPAALGRVHPARRTPMIATAVVTAATLVLALALPLVSLARATSAAILVVFALINLALLRLRRRNPAPPGVRAWPAAVPAAGFVLSLLLLGFQLAELLK